MKHLLWLAAPFLLASAQDVPAPAPKATLSVPQADGSSREVERFAAPQGREGASPVAIWRNGEAAYRLTLDARSAPVALIGSEALPVADGSLGVGGLGVLRDGGAEQLGPSRISARVFNGERAATVLVETRGFAGAGGAADLSTTYRIFAESRLTHVEARATGSVPVIVAGLGRDPQAIRLPTPKTGAWRYIASWTGQGAANGVGLALFYPADEIESQGFDDRSSYVRFCDPRHIRYAFAASPSGETGAPGDARAFRRWLDETAAELARRPRVIPTGQKLCPVRG